MPPEETRTGDPAEWLRFAQGDLKLARASSPGIPTELLCFHAQQAAEKAIKAVLLSVSLPVPHVHDIKLLFDRLPVPVNVSRSVQRAPRLTKYAVISRYPADLGVVGEKEYREALLLVEATVRWAEVQVKKR